MNVVSICRAYVDLVAPVTEEELQKIGFKPGDDCFLAEDRLQQLVEKYSGRGTTLAGGPAANTVATIAALGGKAAFIGKIGDDSLGRVFVDDFRRRGVFFNTELQARNTTACCIVLVTPDGERTLLYNARGADKITTDDIEANRIILNQTQFLYLGLTYRIPACQEIIHLARYHAPQAKIVVGLQSYENGTKQSALHLLDSDILLGNQQEFQSLLNALSIENLQKLSAVYPHKLFACTLGAQGATIASAGKTIAVPAAQAEIIKDTTGAGDAWAAGFIYGLSQGQPLVTAGQLGSAIAAQILAETGGRFQSWPIDNIPVHG